MHPDRQRNSSKSRNPEYYISMTLKVSNRSIASIILKASALHFLRMAMKRAHFYLKASVIEINDYYLVILNILAVSIVL